MLPWLMPIQDNLQFLVGGNRNTLQMYMDQGKIEIEALTYIRGRSIANAFIIIDEAQNLTSHEIKTIMTRVGEGTKIVLTGDIEQIDNVYVNETSNGLAHAVEKFKEYPIAGHVTFTKGERSEVATLASKVLNIHGISALAGILAASFIEWTVHKHVLHELGIGFYFSFHAFIMPQPEGMAL